MHTHTHAQVYMHTYLNPVTTILLYYLKKFKVLNFDENFKVLMIEK